MKRTRATSLFYAVVAFGGGCAGNVHEMDAWEPTVGEAAANAPGTSSVLSGAANEELTPTAPVDDAAGPGLKLLGQVRATPSIAVKFHASKGTDGQLFSQTEQLAGQEGLEALLPNVDTRRLIPSDYYALFEPSTTVPQELLETEQRLQLVRDPAVFAAALRDVAQLPDPDTQPHALSHQGGCDPNWFRDTQCFAPGVGVLWCETDRISNGKHGKFSRVDYMEVKVCTDIGSVIMTVHGEATRVDSGHIARWAKFGGVFGISPTAQVTEVSPGERYHWFGVVDH